MKKGLLGLSILLLIFGLTGCKSEDDVEDLTFDVGNEVYINVQDLPYAEYLNLTNPVVTITVAGMGDIVIQLFPEVAPNTVNNFIAYIEAGVYTDNEFHRVINHFVIQGGDIPNPSCTIEGEMTSNDFENPLLHDRGVISMAHVDGDYNSANSQFFIMHTKTEPLDEEYAAFGGMITGFSILDYIANLNDGSNEVPIVPVYITSITVDLKGVEYADPICYTPDND